MGIESSQIQQAFPLGSHKQPDPNFFDKWGPVVSAALEAIGRVVGSYYGGSIGGQFGAEGGRNQGNILARAFRNREDVMPQYQEMGIDTDIKIGGQSGKSQVSESLKGKTTPGGRRLGVVRGMENLTPKQREQLGNYGIGFDASVHEGKGMFPAESFDRTTQGQRGGGLWPIISDILQRRGGNAGALQQVVGTQQGGAGGAGNKGALLQFLKDMYL